MGLIGIRKQALNTLTAHRKIADGDIQPSAVNPYSVEMDSFNMIKTMQIESFRNCIIDTDYAHPCLRCNHE